MFPLWGADTGALARTMIDGGLRASLCCVDTTQLDGRFAGHRFDDTLLAALPETADLCGEFHTAVFSGPMFSAPVSASARMRTLRETRFIYALPEALESGHIFDGDTPWPTIT